MSGRSFTATVGLALLVMGACRTPCAAETLVYSMQYRTAAEAVPKVQSLLSSGGRAVTDARTNALLVMDNEETIQRVREFLQGFDKLGDIDLSAGRIRGSMTCVERSRGYGHRRLRNQL